jgi:hypothetical protein
MVSLAAQTIHHPEKLSRNCGENHHAADHPLPRSPIPRAAAYLNCRASGCGRCINSPEFDISRPAIFRRGRKKACILDVGQLAGADRWLVGRRAAPRSETRPRLVPRPHATVGLFSFAG